MVKSLFPNIVASARSPKRQPDMWIHWVSTYYVDPENWLGDFYDSANWGTWKSSSLLSKLPGSTHCYTGPGDRWAGGARQFYEEACRLIVEDAPDIWVYSQA